MHLLYSQRSSLPLLLRFFKMPSSVTVKNVIQFSNSYNVWFSIFISIKIGVSFKDWISLMVNQFMFVKTKFSVHDAACLHNETVTPRSWLMRITGYVISKYAPQFFWYLRTGSNLSYCPSWLYLSLRCLEAI